VSIATLLALVLATATIGLSELIRIRRDLQMTPRRRGLTTLLVMLCTVFVGGASASLAYGQHAFSADRDLQSPSRGMDVARQHPTITIKVFSFTVPVRVDPGVMVKVVNRSKYDHTVTSDDGSWSEVHIPKHSTVKFKAPTTPGKYSFHCAIHPSMKATLNVE
jgi:plastocyanin